MSSTGSSIRARTLARTKATASPISTPPPAAQANCRPIRHTATDADRAAIAVRSSTSDVASLTRLSPSRMVTTRRGRPTRRATAVVATASGGATMAPSANAAAKDSPGTTQRATTATTSAVKATRPTESSAIGRRLRRMSISEVRIAAAYSRGGSSPMRTRSGSSR